MEWDTLAPVGVRNNQRSIDFVCMAEVEGGVGGYMYCTV